MRNLERAILLCLAAVSSAPLLDFPVRHLWRWRRVASGGFGRPFDCRMPAVGAGPLGGGFVAAIRAFVMLHFRALWRRGNLPMYSTRAGSTAAIPVVLSTHSIPVNSISSMMSPPERRFKKSVPNRAPQTSTGFLPGLADSEAIPIRKG